MIDGIAFVDGRVIANTLATSRFFAEEVLKGGKAGKVTELKLAQPVQRPDGMRVSGRNSMISSDARGKLMRLTITGDSAHVQEVASGVDGVTSLAIVGNMVYALEAQLALYNQRPGWTAAAAGEAIPAGGLRAYEVARARTAAPDHTRRWCFQRRCPQVHSQGDARMSSSTMRA